MRYFVIYHLLFIAAGCVETKEFVAQLQERAQARAVEQARADSILHASLPANTWPAIDKIKGRTIIFQMGTGNTATTTDKVRADAVASGAGSTASATTHKGPPAWVYALFMVVGGAAWEYASSYLPRAWLSWRVRPG